MPNKTVDQPNMIDHNTKRGVVTITKQKVVKVATVVVVMVDITKIEKADNMKVKEVMCRKILTEEEVVEVAEEVVVATEETVEDIPMIISKIVDMTEVIITGVDMIRNIRSIIKLLVRREPTTRKEVVVTEKTDREEEDLEVAEEVTKVEQHQQVPK
jgi:hypothetical protein